MPLERSLTSSSFVPKSLMGLTTSDWSTFAIRQAINFVILKSVERIRRRVKRLYVYFLFNIHINFLITKHKVNLVNETDSCFKRIHKSN